MESINDTDGAVKPFDRSVSTKLTFERPLEEDLFLFCFISLLLDERKCLNKKLFSGSSFFPLPLLVPRANDSAPIDSRDCKNYYGHVDF